MIAGILGIIVVIAMVFLGVNEHVLQFVGSVGESLPLVGSWVNVISAFTRDTLGTSVTSSFTVALQTLLQCLASNILDAFFLGLLFALVSDGLATLRGGQWNKVWNIGTTVVTSLVGVILLYLMKKAGSGTYTVFVSVADIGLLVVGIIIMLSGRFPGLSLSSFVIHIAIGAFESAGGIGLACTVLLAPSMVRKGITAGGMVLWFLCLAGLIVVLRLVRYAQQEMFGKR